jgi:hypothetical protein
MRVKMSGDSTKWTPLEALKFLVAEIEAGRQPAPSSVFVAMRVESERGAQYPCVVAGLKTSMEYIGLLGVHLHEVNAYDRGDN